MQYYISWTHSDPIYHERLPDLGVLVSPPNVNQVWTVYQWPALPPHLLLDSGAFQYMRNGRSPHPRDVLQRQLRMLANANFLSAICHLDVPLVGTTDPGDLQRRVITSLENAQWLISQAADEGVPPTVELVGVIQGHTVAMVYNVACALADMGYTRFALGFAWSPSQVSSHRFTHRRSGFDGGRAQPDSRHRRRLPQQVGIREPLVEDAYSIGGQRFAAY